MTEANKDKSGYIKRSKQFANEIKNGLSKETKKENADAKKLMKTLFS